MQVTTLKMPTADRRRPAWASVRNPLSALLLGCFLWLIMTGLVYAEENGTASITVLPADGQARGVQLRAQTVDAVIRSSQGALWADTRVWVYLYNPGKGAVIMPVSLPGPQLAPVPLPEKLEVTLDRTPLALTPLPPREGSAQVRASTVITVPARGAATLQINYRQALPVQEGLATFAYFLTETAKWSGRPESLRLTVRFDPPLATGQLLGTAPMPHLRTDGELTWHWENTKATQNIGVAFVAPDRWAALEEARRAAAPGAGLAAYRYLAERYWQLVNLSPPSFQSEGYFERFFPAAVAALQAGLADPGPEATPTDMAAARLRLAQFYQARADRLQEAEGALFYLQAAAVELDTALALHAEDPDVREAATRVRRRLAVLAQERGDLLGAQEHEARLMALTTPAGLPSAETQAQLAALAQAEAALAQGDRREARRLILAAFGPDVAPAAFESRPRIEQALVTVTTTPAGRAVEVQVAGETGAIRSLLTEAGLALAAVADAAVEGNRLSFTLPYTEPTYLLAAQTHAADALARFPELALLAAALRPAALSWQITEAPFIFLERYVESIDLAPARDVWMARAERLRAEAAAAQAARGTSIEMRLRRVQGGLWADDALAWRALAERSRAVYRVTLGRSDVTRIWELAPGDAQPLAVEARVWRYERLAWVAGGIALLLVLMVVVVWRATR